MHRLALIIPAMLLGASLLLIVQQSQPSLQAQLTELKARVAVLEHHIDSTGQ